MTKLSDIKFDPANVLTGEAFDKLIEECHRQCDDIEKRKEITDWDSLNKPMDI